MSQRPSSERPSTEREGLSKYVRRMSTILRRGSKRLSISSLGDVTGGESSKAAAKSASSTKPAATATATTPTTSKPPATTTTTTAATNRPTGYRWSAVQQERARALFAKYGLTLEPEEWMSPRNLNVERVEKPIRMRVRRTCHRCQTTFGADKVCVGCQHVRCKKCPRYPPARSKEEKEARAKAKAEGKTAQRIEVDEPKKSKPPVLTIPSRTGGQDLVRKPIRQRVRRTCHRCQTLFIGDAKECTNCHHIRCKKCPRDPAKLHKYPDGYPGDADPPPEPRPRVWRKPRRRVRWICHQCSTLYQPGERTCSNCGQEKGPQTIRDPPKKVKPEPDPEIVRRVEERLAQLNINT
ncbi:hypothetical protein VTN77DRAFT_2402 [Rasamsonia byssochlamydoides]|uniref:uncharacterized protein n=1 Tax=Rasamsonia byssochlamydoides TaxID=89139 RepID=UPI0037444442